MSEFDKFSRHQKMIDRLTESSEGRLILLNFIASEAKLAQLLGEDIFSGEVPDDNDIDNGGLLRINDGEIQGASESKILVWKWIKRKKLREWSKNLFAKLNDLVKSYMGGGDD